MHRTVLVAAALALLTSCADRARHSVALYEAGDYAGARDAAATGLTSHPGDDALWGMRVRAALALGQADEVDRAYADYVRSRGDDDRDLVRGLALATLGQALASPSVQLKVAAIEAIERLEIQSFADQVAQAMGDNDDRVVAAASIAVLHGYPQAPKVAADMRKSELPEARRIIIAGIARKVGAPARSDLEAATSDPDPRVRRAALAGLALLRVGDPEVIAHRLGDPDDSVRAEAASALAVIGAGDLDAFARRALADRATAVRVGGVALLAAGKRRDPLAQLADDPDLAVALAAAGAYEQLAHDGHRGRGRDEPISPLAAGVLKRAVASPSWQVRAGAANWLAQAGGGDAALAMLRPLAQDPDVRVRLAAARALADLHERDPAIAVLRAALDGDEALQAATALAVLDRDPAALAKLSALVRDRARTPEQRAEAARAHREVGRITSGLVAALADPSGLVRVEAAIALAAMTKAG